MSEEQATREREAREREEELRAVPLQKIDKSKWPRAVRPIAIDETNGLGIDGDGRLYWNGRPVEIIGRRLDLTKTQTGIALAVAIFTGIAALGTVAQAWTVYHDWACRIGWPSLVTCPKQK